MASKLLVESFYSHTIQSNMDTTSTSVNVDVAPTNTVGYAVLEVGEANQEMIKWQGLTSLTLSSLLRGLSLTASTDTEVSGNKKSHAIDDTIEQTNVHYIVNDKVSNAAEETIAGLKTFTLAPKSSAAATATTELMRYDETVRLTSDQTIAGIKIFSSIPLGPASDPTTANQLCRKSYVDARPAQILSYDTYYVGEAITDRNALSREPLDNTDGGSDASFGRDTVSAGVYQAQSFVAGSVASSFSMTVSLKKVGAPADNVYIEIQGDSSGSPDGTPVTDGTSNDVAAGSIGAGYTDIAFTWASDPTLVAGTLYWIVLKRDGAVSDAAYYQVEYASNNAFRSGAMKKYTSSWTTNTGADDDAVFAISGVDPVAVKAINTSANSSRGRLGFLGFANAAASVGATVEIQTHGKMTGFTSLTAGTAYCIHTGAGAVIATITNPYVGIAIDTTTMLVNKAYVNSEMETFFGATDMTGAEAEQLTDGSEAETLHYHSELEFAATSGYEIYSMNELKVAATDSTDTDAGGYFTHVTVAQADKTAGRMMLPPGGSSLHDKNPEFYAPVKYNAATAQEGFIGYVSSAFGGGSLEDAAMTIDHFGFVIQDGTLYGSCADGTTQSKTAAITATITNYNEYRATFDGTTVTFYLNGVSVGTLNTNVPDSNLNYFYCVVIADASAAAKTISIAKTGRVKFDKTVV